MKNFMVICCSFILFSQYVVASNYSNGRQRHRGPRHPELMDVRIGDQALSKSEIQRVVDQSLRDFQYQTERQHLLKVSRACAKMDREEKECNECCRDCFVGAFCSFMLCVGYCYVK